MQFPKQMARFNTALCAHMGYLETFFILHHNGGPGLHLFRFSFCLRRAITQKLSLQRQSAVFYKRINAVSEAYFELRNNKMRVWAKFISVRCLRQKNSLLIYRHCVGLCGQRVNLLLKWPLWFDVLFLKNVS